jgi:hypothetical protein
MLIACCRAQQDDDAHVCVTAWQSVRKFVNLDEKLTSTPKLPPIPKYEDHVRYAKLFRDRMEALCLRDVCAVCSSYRPLDTMHTCTWDEVPNLQLLSANIPPTDKHPRAALTTVERMDERYCLQPAGMIDPESMRICRECHNDLVGKRVPTASLVAFDTGAVVM